MANNKTLLEKWLNPIYLKEPLVQDFRQFYQKNKKELQFMQWTDFLRPEKAKTLTAQLKKEHYKEKYRPDIYRYKESQSSKAVEPFLNFLKSDALRDYIQTIFEKTYEQRQVQLRSYGSGDYTVLHDAAETYEGFLLIYEPGAEWRQEYGGYEVVVRPKEDPLIIPPRPNTLAVINCTKETRWFTKYINSLAGDKKRYVIWCECK